MSQNLQTKPKNQDLVVLKKTSSRKQVQWKEAFLVLKPDSGSRVVKKAIAALTLACENAAGGSLEKKFVRLSGDEFDRAILAVLFLEGINLQFRESLRKAPNLTLETDKNLPAATLVRWLSGGDSILSEEIAKRIHPQSPLTTEGFIERRDAFVPLEGTIRLSSSLAGLMVADGFKSRLLEWGMKLEWPEETLNRVVINERLEKEVTEAVEFARKEDRLNLLLWGQPGTGKTLLARALARELGKPLLTLEASNSMKDPDLLLRGFLAARVEGAVLFLDEFDRWAGVDDNDMPKPASSGILLTHMECFNGILVGATNHLPSQPFRRRFQYLLSFCNPKPPEAKRLWALHLGDGTDLEICEKLAGEFEMSGGLIANAVSTAKAIAKGAMPDLKTLRDAAAGQFPNLFGWEDKWAFYSDGTEPWDWLTPECQNEVLALAARLKEAKSWARLVQCSFRLDRGAFHKALMLSNSIVVLSEVCRRLAEAADLRPLYQSISFLQNKLKANAEMNLKGIFTQLTRGGFLPILIVDDIRKEAEFTQILKDFEDFYGVGVMTCLENCYRELDFKPRETLRLVELPSVQAAHTIRTYYMKETDTYRFEGVEAEELIRLCGKDNPREVLSLAVLEARAKAKSGEKAVVNLQHVNWALKTRAANVKGVSGYLFD